jgi:predicted nucleic-acid-binding protein
LFNQATKSEVELVSSTLTFFETAWVLKSFYAQDKSTLISSLKDILSLNFIHLEDRDVLINCLELYKTSNLSLEDCYHLIKAKSVGCDTFGSFDQLAVNTFKKL